MPIHRTIRVRTASTAQHTPATALWLICIGSLAIIGLLFIYASSSCFALAKHHSSLYFVIRQASGLLAGLTLITCIQLLPFNWILKYASPILMGAIILNLLPIYFPQCATTIHGSARWLRIGSISFQPSELLKVALLLKSTQILSQKSFPTSHTLANIMPLVISTSISIFAFLSQPDFGQAALMLITVCIQLLLAHPSLYYFRLLTIPSIALIILLILIAPYRIQRILQFLDPWKDPQGRGFQIIQSHIAIGGGGLIGRGFGCSNQKFFYLPMQHTDFIFSIIAEETGIIGVCTTIGLYITVLWSWITLAHQSTTPATRIFISGAACMTALQAAINLAVTTGIAPTKGIGLPFVSYGISSLIGYSILIGLTLSALHVPRSQLPSRN